MKKRILYAAICMVMAFAMLLPGVMSEAYAADTDIANVRNGVVRMVSVYQNDDVGTGSAFGVGTVGQPTDIFVTNRHVVVGPDEYGREDVARRIFIALDDNAVNYEYTYLVDDNGTLYYQVDQYGNTYEASITVDVDESRLIPCDVLYISDEYDFAILRTTELIDKRVALELAASSEAATPGTTVYSVGYPGVADDIMDTTSLEDTGAVTYADDGTLLHILTRNTSVNSYIDDMSVTQGIVSRQGFLQDEAANVLQHDAEIHGGNSGGPLVDATGKVVGINTYGVDDVASLNYAIYIDYVIEALDSLGIAYNLNGGGSGGFPILGIVVLAAAAAAVGIFLKRKKDKPSVGQVTEPGPNPEVVKPVVGGVNDLRFQGVKGLYTGKRYSINGTVRFGRNPQNDIVYPADTKGISGVHCSLACMNGGLYIQDLGSTYGTYVNGAKITPNKMIELKLGDKFALGSDQEIFAIVPRGGM